MKIFKGNLKYEKIIDEELNVSYYVLYDLFGHVIATTNELNYLCLNEVIIIDHEILTSLACFLSDLNQGLIHG